MIAQQHEIVWEIADFNTFYAEAQSTSSYSSNSIECGNTFRLGSFTVTCQLRITARRNQVEFHICYRSVSGVSGPLCHLIIHALDEVGKPCNRKAYYETLTKYKETNLSDFISDLPKSLLEQTNLKLSIQINLLESETRNVTSSLESEIQPLFSDLSMEENRRKEINTDVSLVCQGRESIPCYASVLCAQSRVFAAMFTHDSREKRTGKIHLPDVSPKVGEAFAQYLHSNTLSTDKFKDTALDLLILAEKYEVLILKDSCEKILMNNLTIQSAGEVLRMADLHNAEKLKA